MARRHYIDNAAVVALTSSINSSVTSLTVTSASTMPASLPWTAVIDAGTATAEIVLVTAAAGATLTVTRGYDGTSAQAHANAAPFAHVAVKADYDEANAHVNASSGVHGVVGAVVGDTDAQTLTNKTLSSATVTGNLPVSGNVTAVGNVSAGGTLAVTGNATITGNTTITGTISASNLVARSSVVARRADATVVNGVDVSPTHITVYDTSVGVLGTDISFASGVATVNATGHYRWGASVDWPVGTALAGAKMFLNGTAIGYGQVLVTLNGSHRTTMSAGDVLPLTSGDTLELGLVSLDGVVNNVVVHSFTITREA